MLSPEDLHLIDRLHGGFPLTERPYLDVARELGWTEERVLERLRTLLSEGVLTRFGPLFQIERAGGQFVLAAMVVPPARYEEVTQQLNAIPEVAHNYRREHELNMWFVLATETAAATAGVLQQIETLTGLKVYAFPKEREYFVELRLPLQTGMEMAHAAE